MGSSLSKSHHHRNYWHEETGQVNSINGQLMSVLIDDHPTRFLDHGVLSIQLEGRGDNKASFRNLWLKDLR